jgi:flagellar basal-body rod protein FlgG
MSSSAAITAMEAAQKAIDVQVNNIANLKTIAFKKSDLQTSDLFYTELKRAGTLENANNTKRPVGAQIGCGTKVSSVNRNLEQGQIKQTNQPLDIALTGPGYFAIAMPNFRNGRAYTRDGSFHLDPESRRIVTSRSEPLEQDIAIPPDITADRITIDPDGKVSVTHSDNIIEEIATIEIFTFPNEQGLEAKSNNLFSETDGSGDGVIVDNPNGRFAQKALESSNVSSIAALTDMIAAQRQYEMASRALRIKDEMEERLTK